MLNELTTSGPVPESMIETPAGLVLIDSGYARLLQALDEAYEVDDHVVVSLAGPDRKIWQFVVGDHLRSDGSLELGEGVVVLSNSTTPDDLPFTWRGGHAVGDRRLQRFSLGGVAMTIEWTHPRPGS